MSAMQRGRLTIPTDADYAEGTKKFIKEWGADAVRDCDGVSLPEDVKQFGCEVYKAYFIVREDHAYAKAHEEYWQNAALMSQRKVATGDTLTIDLLADTFREGFRVNTDRLKEFSGRPRSRSTAATTNRARTGKRKGERLRSTLSPVMPISRAGRSAWMIRSAFIRMILMNCCPDTAASTPSIPPCSSLHSISIPTI